MIRDILSPADCAECRQCCCFDRSEFWETPRIETEAAENIHQKRQDLRFTPLPDHDCLVLCPCEKDYSDPETFSCPALSEQGCTLGEEKPFECALFPFRLMELDGNTLICISPMCPVMFSKPLDMLMDELDRPHGGITLAEQIFAYGDRHPDMIRNYEQGCPVLKVRIKIENNHPVL